MLSQFLLLLVLFLGILGVRVVSSKREVYTARLGFIWVVMKIVIESPENSLIVIWKKLLACGIEKVDGLLCKLSFRLLSHYTHILSLLMHLSTSIVDFNNTISNGGGGGGGGGKKIPRGATTPLYPHPK